MFYSKIITNIKKIKAWIRIKTLISSPNKYKKNEYTKINMPNYYLEAFPATLSESQVLAKGGA